MEECEILIPLTVDAYMVAGFEMVMRLAEISETDCRLN